MSWTENMPETSLRLIEECQLPKSARIIDVGGGDSKLIDFLLERGYEQLTVLDISAKALDRMKERLGDKAQKVHFIVADITRYVPDIKFDLWHDRAAFHFLTAEKDIQYYLKLLTANVSRYLVLGTFSHKGPEKCSGLPVHRYSEAALTEMMKGKFEKAGCITEDHITPFGTRQNFLFCRFQKSKNKK